MTTIIRQRITAGSATDTGRVRPQNEDACFVDTERGLFIVSDGMGGANAGALASQVVVKVLPQLITQRLATLKQVRKELVIRLLGEAIAKLSQQVHDQSADRIGFKGMGATVVVALILGRQLYIGHMGDSRAYLLREGRLKQLTKDHSITQLLIDSGEITPDEAKTHPARGKITRFVGMEGEPLPEACSLKCEPGDLIMLCTDGLHGMLNEKQILTILGGKASPTALCRRLVSAANSAGGKDNITVVVTLIECNK